MKVWVTALQKKCNLVVTGTPNDNKTWKPNVYKYVNIQALDTIKKKGVTAPAQRNNYLQSPWQKLMKNKQVSCKPHYKFD